MFIGIIMDILSDYFLTNDPFQAFTQWLEEAKIKGDSYDQFVLSTIAGRRPNARVLLLKEMQKTGPVFFTNYQSKKGEELEQNPKASLVFWWPKLARQVRIQGTVEKVTEEESNAYFKSREKSSQIASYISKQSTVLRDRAELEEKFNLALEEFKDGEVVRPKEWGGYRILPLEWEFFLYREHRLNDRFQFYFENNIWKWRRLAP
jgi:pyridoxamine 5'-phosphate oxidase